MSTAHISCEGLDSIFLAMWKMTAHSAVVNDNRKFFKNAVPFFLAALRVLVKGENDSVLEPLLGVLSNIAAAQQSWRVLVTLPVPIIDCVADCVNQRTKFTGRLLLRFLCVFHNVVVWEEGAVFFLLTRQGCHIAVNRLCSVATSFVFERQEDRESFVNVARGLLASLRKASVKYHLAITADLASALTNFLLMTKI